MTTRDIVFSFDDTGSMRPCIKQVRNVIVQTVGKLFKDIDFLRIGIIAHGDYCDGSRMITTLPLTNNQAEIKRFVETVPDTSGGDLPEAYEAVLNHARHLNWKAGEKALVMIGDDVPHRKGSPDGAGDTVKFDWRIEAAALGASGIRIYPVQALNRSYANSFYDGLAEGAGTPKISLDQFSDMPDILMALAYQNAGQLDQFEREIKTGTRKVSNSVLRTLDQLAGRRENLSKRSLSTGGKYQVLDVERDMSIQSRTPGRSVRRMPGVRDWSRLLRVDEVGNHPGLQGSPRSEYRERGDHHRTACPVCPRHCREGRSAKAAVGDASWLRAVHVGQPQVDRRDQVPVRNQGIRRRRDAGAGVRLVPLISTSGEK